jgi:hypothetical protein
MKQGRTLGDLVIELDRQMTTKRDFLADTRRLALKPVRGDQGGRPKLILDGVNGGMELRPGAHGQLAAALGIPKTYYDKMHAEAPALLCASVNRWLHTNSPAPGTDLIQYDLGDKGVPDGYKPVVKMIRTLDGQVRAVLSDSYRPLDNLDLAKAALPALAKQEAEVVSSEVTENRLYIKAVTPKVQAVVAKIKPGVHKFLKPGETDDIVQAGIVISNSEVGQGSLQVAAMTYRLACYNGMIEEVAVRKAHLGRSTRGADALEEAREFFRDETRRADDKAFFLKVQDACAAIFLPERFNARVDKYRDAGQRAIAGKPVEVMEITAKRFDLNDEERDSVLTHLLQGGDLSQWGLANAITRASQDVESYDRATELEKLGGTVIELAPGEWKSLAA